MEILAIITLLFLTGVVVAVQPMKLTKSLYCIVIFIVGILTPIEGITYGSTTLIAVNTSFSYVILAFLTLGSLVTIYGTAVGQSEKAS
jgi:hypothetical protein